MLAPAVSLKHVAESAAGPVLATFGTALLLVQQDATQGGITAQLVAIVTGALSATGFLGYAAKRFTDNLWARWEEERAAEREERKVAHEREQRMLAYYEAQIAYWQQAFEKERTRNETLVTQVLVKNVVPPLVPPGPS